MGSSFFRTTLLALLCASSSYAATPTPENPDIITLGVEGFRDHYQEDSLGVNSHANYGSLTGSYTSYYQELFGAVDGRVSYGHDSYSSPSGSESEVPQWEFELRGRGGITVWSDADADVGLYSGLGLRYYIDEGKDHFTATSFSYDRRIVQLYLPVGATYKTIVFDDWTISPTIEYDQLLWGSVNSRVLNGGWLNPVYKGCNPYNTQTSGYGIRGDLMLGQQINDVFSWEFGPFVRYWNIKQSDTVLSGNFFADEPANNRLQVGLALKGSF